MRKTNLQRFAGTQHRWDTVKGLHIITLFDSEGVITMASEADHFVEAYASVFKTAILTGEPYLNNQQSVQNLRGLLNELGYKKDTPVSQGGWIRLPKQTREEAELLRLVIPVREFHQLMLDGLPFGTDPTVVAEHRFRRRYKYDETTQTLTRVSDGATWSA